MDPSVYLYLLLVVSSIVSFKIGRSTRKARYDENVVTCQTVQQSISSAQSAVSDATSRMEWVLVDYPSAAPDYAKNSVEQAIKRVEARYSPATGLLEKAKDLQARGTRTSPYVYASNSADLHKIAQQLDEAVAYLNSCISSLEEDNERFSAPALQNCLADLQRRYIDFLTGFVKDANKSLSSIRRDRRFKEFTASVDTIETEKRAVAESLDTGTVDRYVINLQITELRDSCVALSEVHCQLDPDARLFYSLGTILWKKRLQAKNRTAIQQSR